MRISLACGGATSISSITRGLLGSHATAALHLMTYRAVTPHEVSHYLVLLQLKYTHRGFRKGAIVV